MSSAFRLGQRLATLETLLEVSEKSTSSASSQHQVQPQQGYALPGKPPAVPKNDKAELGPVTEEIVQRYGRALALHDIDAERRRVVDDQAGVYMVLVVGKDEAHSSLGSALRATAKMPNTQRALIYLQGDQFEETETLELSGTILIQPDPGNNSTRPVIRIAGPIVGLKCATASANVTFRNVRLELDSSVRQALYSVQVCSKPLVHPASNGHCSLHTGFISGRDKTLSTCLDVSMGQVALQRSLVVNLTGDGVCVSGTGLAVIEDTHIKAVGRHGLLVASQGVASLTDSTLSGCGGCGCVATGSESSVHLVNASVELNTHGGLLVESGSHILAEACSFERNGGPGVLLRNRGSRLVLVGGRVLGNEGDGVQVALETGKGNLAARCKREDVTSLNALAAARSDALMQMRGLAPVPIARSAGGGDAVVEMLDCEVAHNKGSGVRLHQALARCKLRTVQVHHNGADGVRVVDGAEAVVFDSRMEGNDGSGAWAHGGGALCLLACSHLVANAVGARADGGEVRLHKCKVGRNRRGEVLELNGGKVEEEVSGEGRGKWVEGRDGLPQPTNLHCDLPWLVKLRDKLKTNTLRTWHGF